MTLFLGACDDPSSRKRRGSGDGGEYSFCKHSQREKDGYECILHQDAWILANLINKAICQEGSSIRRVADVYSATRTSFVNWVTNLSREQGLRYELLGAGFEDVQEGEAVSAERLTELGRTIERDWEWTWKTSPVDELEKTLSMLDRYHKDEDKSKASKFGEFDPIKTTQDF